jgi:4-amino-4-deoxy-L-arabinose transferase-like glycosyltransferase
MLAADAVFGLLVLVVAFAGSVSLPAPPTGATASQSVPAEVATRFGGLSPPGQTTGFALAADGSLGVVDRGRQVVIRLDANGLPMAEWGPSFGPGLEAKDLVGLAADGDGWYLLDRGALRILRLDSHGQAMPQRTINLEPLATYGPNGLATDAHGNLYMADTGRDRIVVFDSAGRMTGALGDSGTELGKFKQPMGLAFGPDGSMLVSDWENQRIERWTLDGSAPGGWRASNAWRLPSHAWGITTDQLGRVFVPDADHREVRMFGPDGSLLAEIGGEGKPPVPVEFASQVAVSPDGTRLWVLGSDGLARVDLAPYASLQPGAAPRPVNIPLAILGGLMLVFAAAIAGRSQLAATRKQRIAHHGAPHAERYVAPESPPPQAPEAPPSAVRRLIPDRVAAPLGAVLLALGGIGVVIAGLLVADPTAQLEPWSRLAALVLGSLVFATGCRLSLQARPAHWLATWPGRPGAPRSASPRSRSMTTTAVVLCAVLAGAAATIWWQAHFETVEATRAALLWLAGVLIAVAVCARAAPAHQMTRPTARILIPWLLFAVALAPRVWHNADLPYGVWFDEAEAGLQARKFLQGVQYTPITDTYGRDASLFYYLIAAAQTLIPDPVLAARLVSATVGALCAPLVYLLGRELFGWQVGVVAGLVLATSRWHVDVSRLGWDPISLTLCAILAFWLLARAVRTGTLRDAGWAGLALGLGMHAYIGFRALPLIGFGLLIYAAWVRRWSLRTLAPRLAVFAGTAVLAALPVLVFAIQDPAGFNGRLNQTLILNEPVAQSQKLDELWSNVQKHALMFNISGDMNGRHNLPGAPMLDPVSGLLVVLGLAIVVLRPFDWRSLLLVGWAAVSMAGGIFTFPFEAPQAMRTLGVTPVLALLFAVALVLVLDRCAYVLRGRPTLIRRSLALTGGLVVVWVGATNLSTFFGRQMLDPTVWESFSTRETIPARAALAATSPYEAILGSPTIAPSIQSQLLAPGLVQSIVTFDSTRQLPYRGNGPALVILETEHDAGLADEVARYYPTAPRRPIFGPNAAQPVVDELLLEHDMLTASRGLAATYRGSDGSVVERREPVAHLDSGASPVPLPADVTWQAGLALDAGGQYGFRVPPTFQLAVDGLAVSDTERVELVSGNHLLSLSGTLSDGMRLDLAWQPPGATTWAPIDEHSLFIAPSGGSGLQATFYPSQDWQGSPTVSLIDPVLDHYYHTNPLSSVGLSPQVWSAEWNGTLEAPTDGSYRFDAERLSRAGLWIDDRVVFDDTPEGAAESLSGVVQLTAGRHQLRVRFQDRGDGGPRLYLFWTPPGGARETLSGRVLYPPAPNVVRSP